MSGLGLALSDRARARSGETGGKHAWGGRASKVDSMELVFARQEGPQNILHLNAPRPARCAALLAHLNRFKDYLRSVLYMNPALVSRKEDGPNSDSALYCPAKGSVKEL